MLDRREFLQIGSVGALSLAAGAGSAGGNGSRFGRNYAPHLGLFRHHAGVDPLEQIRFLADEGFRSLEDTGLRAKPIALQRQIGRELTRRGLSLVCFTGVAEFGRPTFASGRPELRQAVLRDLRLAIEAAKRVGARQLSIVPGKRDAVLDPSTQQRNALEMLERCADVCEPRGVTLLLEPIDYGPGHSRLFLRSARDAAALCRSVGRPSCRVLIDVYQQEVAGEDVPGLLPDIADVLGHVQLGDFPGRKEPGSGELDFRKLLATLDAVGYQGALGMEHGTALAGRAGERAVIDAYLALDCCSRCSTPGSIG
jgi:hydroxypyruvate isomerase